MHLKIKFFPIALEAGTTSLSKIFYKGIPKTLPKADLLNPKRG
jgi:hypothetical protein